MNTLAYEQFTVRTTKAAGAILMRYFRNLRAHDHKIKHHKEVVTKADTASNRYVVGQIRKHFPSHDIISEEMEAKLNGSQYSWIIDPLDGTNNFLAGSPVFNVVIALAYKGEPIVGVIYNPVTGDLYTARKDAGAFLNGKRISTSKIKELRDAKIIFCHGSGKNDPSTHRRIYDILHPRTNGTRMFGSAGEEFGGVAHGGFGAFVFTSSTSGIWDYAAGALLVREAGGRVTDLKGKDWTMRLKPHRNVVVVSSGPLHKKLLLLINQKVRR